MVGTEWVQRKVNRQESGATCVSVVCSKCCDWGWHTYRQGNTHFVLFTFCIKSTAKVKCLARFLVSPGACGHCAVELNLLCPPVGKLRQVSRTTQFSRMSLSELFIATQNKWVKIVITSSKQDRTSVVGSNGIVHRKALRIDHSRSQHPLSILHLLLLTVAYLRPQL